MNEQTADQKPWVVVAGVDFSEASDAALDAAMRSAKRAGASELHLVHVLDEKAGPEADKLDVLDAHMDQAVARLRDYAIDHCERTLADLTGSQHTFFHVRLGEAAAQLHQVAVDIDADLIVVGTHARKGMSKLLLGSAAEALLRIAQVSVLIARKKDFTTLEKSEMPDPPETGENLKVESGLSAHSHLNFGNRARTHISGVY